MKLSSTRFPGRGRRSSPSFSGTRAAGPGERFLGVERVEFLGYEDGEVEDTRQLRLDITRQIRRWRPHLIIAQSPDRPYTNFHGWHRDHRITGGVVPDCVYPLARDHLSFPELLPEYEPHNVREVYLIQWERPRLLVDITETMDLKLQAITRHSSQIADFSDLEARLRQRFSALGAPTGYDYAEGFVWVVLFAVAILSSVAMGYHGGLTRRSRSPAILVVALTFAAVIWLVADLDRPSQGLLRVSQQPMIELRHTMQTPNR